MPSARPLRRAAVGGVLCIFAISAGLALQSGGSVSRETGEGLHTVRLATAQGSINVYVPDDVAAGDTIRGTVSYEPSGDTEAKREQNLGTLRGYVVDVAGQPVENTPAWVRAVPAAAAGAIVVRFIDRNGMPSGNAAIPTAARPSVPAAGSGLEIPSFGQAGHPVEIRGRFSGTGEPSKVTIGGREASFLAQSPRKAIARVPTDTAGATDIRIEQQGSTASAPFRVIAVQLSADKLELTRGERTTVHLRLRGLAGLAEPVPLTLTNGSPQVIRLGNTDVERITIRPDSVASDGTVLLDRPVQSKQPGTFAVNALVGPAPRRTFPFSPIALVNITQEETGCACQCAVKITGEGVKRDLKPSSFKLKVAKPKDPTKPQVIPLKAQVELIGCAPADADKEVLHADYAWTYDGNVTIFANGETAELHLPAGVSPTGTVTVAATVEYRCKRKGQKDWASPRAPVHCQATLTVVDANLKACTCRVSIAGKGIDAAGKELLLSATGKQSIALTANATLECVGCAGAQGPVNYTWTYGGPGTLTPGSGGTATLSYDPANKKGPAEGPLRVKASTKYTCDNKEQSTDCSDEITVLAASPSGCNCLKPKVKISHEWQNVRFTEERTKKPVVILTENFASADVVFTANVEATCVGPAEQCVRALSYKWIDNHTGKAIGDGRSGDSRTITIPTKSNVLDVDLAVEVTLTCGSGAAACTKTAKQTYKATLQYVR